MIVAPTGQRPLGVLVLGVGGNVSLGILKALRLSTLPVRIVGACIDPLSFGLYASDRSYVAPPAADPGFAEWVAEVCEREDIQAVLSGVEANLLALAPHAAALRSRTGAVCVVSSAEVLAIGQDKLATARWLEREALPFPPSADSQDEAAIEALRDNCGFPLLAKPRTGKGGHGVVVVENDRALDAVRSRTGMVVQRMLGDAAGEYTAGCFCARDGTLRGTIVMRRSLLDGTTQTAEAGEFSEVREVVESVVRALRPTGPCNVQLRVHDGVPVPFELNVRFSGTTPIRARMGFNEVDAALRHLVLGDDDVRLPTVTHGIALRYINEMYIDDEAASALRRDGRLDEPLVHPLVVEDWGQR